MRPDFWPLMRAISPLRRADASSLLRISASIFALAALSFLLATTCSSSSRSCRRYTAACLFFSSECSACIHPGHLSRLALAPTTGAGDERHSTCQMEDETRRGARRRL